MYEGRQEEKSVEYEEVKEERMVTNENEEMMVEMDEEGKNERRKNLYVCWNMCAQHLSSLSFSKSTYTPPSQPFSSASPQYASHFIHLLFSLLSLSPPNHQFHPLPVPQSYFSSSAFSFIAFSSDTLCRRTNVSVSLSGFRLTYVG